MTLKPSEASVRSHSSIWSAIVTRRANKCQAAIATDTLRELSHRQVLPPRQFHDPFACTLARIAFGNSPAAGRPDRSPTHRGRARSKATAIALS